MLYMFLPTCHQDVLPFRFLIDGLHLRPGFPQRCWRRIGLPHVLTYHKKTLATRDEDPNDGQGLAEIAGNTRIDWAKKCNKTRYGRP
jgi:hypothetical protein